MTAIYNEIDPYAAQWLRNLSDDGHIARGDVVDAPIQSLAPFQVDGAAQFHAFAGLGGWSYALRLAGWPDDVPVWTGSCPCQPFSAAGRRKGVDDERHLWPEWFRLIAECRPAVVFGEQVASGDGLVWFDAVSADLEGAGYAVGASDLAAAGVGAPHIRQRLYFVAIADDERFPWTRVGIHVRGDGENVPAGDGEDDGLANANLGAGGQGRAQRDGRDRRSDAEPRAGSGGDGDTRGVADARLPERRPPTVHRRDRRQGTNGDTQETGGTGERGTLGPLGDPGGTGTGRDGGAGAHPQAPGPGCRGDHRPVGDEPHASGRGDRMGDADDTRSPRWAGLGRDDGAERATAERAGGEPPRADLRGDRDNPWRDLEWLPCLDGRIRPTQPGLRPLADGVSRRVVGMRSGQLRALGNAIVPQAAAAFIRAVMGYLAAGA